MTGARYPVSHIDRARRLYAGGMSYNRIAEVLELGAGGGITVRRWLDPDYAEMIRERVRLRHQRGRFVPGMRVAWTTAEKIAALYDQGCSYEGIAAAVRVYEQRKMSAATVHKLLRDHYPGYRRRTRGNAFGSSADPRRALKVAA